MRSRRCYVLDFDTGLVTLVDGPVAVCPDRLQARLGTSGAVFISWFGRLWGRSTAYPGRGCRDTVEFLLQRTRHSEH